jgi:hypothetical protein
MMPTSSLDALDRFELSSFRQQIMFLKPLDGSLSSLVGLMRDQPVEFSFRARPERLLPYIA